MLAALAAMLLANSPWKSFYQLLLETPVEIRISQFEIAKPLLLWVNDGLMGMFFLLVGLELKREYLEGELSKPGSVALPAFGAIGGMLVPALVYVLINRHDGSALQGWAIPAATDIAFALGILALLGSRVPLSLKVFLTSLAIFDDIGAIVIIALFYTSKISTLALFIALGCIVVLVILNRRNVVEQSPYLLVGAIMWAALLKSGVHATLAGIILALFIPMRDRENPEHSPAKSLEHDLHAAVAFLILPLFAFCNAGIDFSGVSAEQLTHGINVGIAAGLFLGKPVGIILMCWLCIRLGRAKLPQGVDWATLCGTAVLCGIGFTMSLFLGSLAFEEAGGNSIVDERIGIVAGSLASGILGFLLLRRSLQSQGRPTR